MHSFRSQLKELTKFYTRKPETQYVSSKVYFSVMDHSDLTPLVQPRQRV